MKNLEQIQATWPQIKWTVIPPVAPQRIGGAEVIVNMTKKSVHYLPTLSILEFDAVLKNIASTINNHPLDSNVTKDQLLTPHQFLLGSYLSSGFHTECKITALLLQVQAIVSSWFVLWNNIMIRQLFNISNW